MKKKLLFLYFLVILCLLTNKIFSQGVGIGIASPISVLHIYESTTNVGTSAGLTVEQNSTGDAVVQYLLTGGQRWVTGIDNSDGDKFKISSTVDVGSTPRLTIQTSGEVGIGTASPAGKLHLYEATGTTTSATAATLILEHGNSGGESGILFKSNVNAGSDYGYIKYSDDGSGNGSTNENGLLEIGIQNDGVSAATYQDDISIMPSGYLGVNTRTPGSTLHVNGAGRFGYASTTNGSIIFNNSTNANTVTVQSGVTSSSYTLTMPTAQGATNSILVNNGSGTLSWVSSGITTRYTIAAGSTNTFYSDTYIQIRWNTTADDIEFTPQSGHTGWWDSWQVFERTPDNLEGSTANSGADDTNATTAGTWYDLNTGFTENEYGPGGIIYLTKEDSNAYPIYKIEYIQHGNYHTFLVTVIN